jgi:RNA polymerase-binding transcription factor DksA
MRREDDADPRPGPRWRAILEARWRIRLQEVTELSVAYHTAAADAPGGIHDRTARRLLRRAVAARQRLADTEDALGRVKAGRFGRCEECVAPIPDAVLDASPEARYCGRCADLFQAGVLEAAIATAGQTRVLVAGAAAGETRVLVPGAAAGLR